MLRRRTSGHNRAKAGGGRSQLRTQAFQASCSASSLNPGSSSQPTGTQRLPAWFSVPTGPVPGSGGGKGVASGGRPVGSVVGGAVEHAASVPTIRAVATRRRNAGNSMGLILLEALGALVLLVGIVWWTMFSGRSRGELRPPPAEPPVPAPPPEGLPPAASPPAATQPPADPDKR